MKKRVPDLDAPDEEILAFIPHHFNFDSTYRCRQMERMARNLFYFIGRQWIELDVEAIPDGVRGYIFRDTPQGEVNFPRPVINKIAPTVEVELATLSKRELVPNVVSSSSDPRMVAAAKVAKEILNFRLDKLHWADLRDMATFLNIVCGVSVIKSWWDETFMDTTLIASPDAVGCPACPTTLSSRTVMKDQLPGLKNLESAYGETEDTVQINHCPTCDNPIPLIPKALSQEEASGKDLLGRPLGLELPKGNTNLEVVSPFDIFPENAGIDINPINFKMMGQATVRSLDWVEERWPKMMEDIAPDGAEELLEKHPILGEWQYMGTYDSAADSGVYDNHVLVYEVHVEKCYRFPEGRSFTVVGEKTKKIVENGVLYRSSDEGTSVPKVKYGVAQFKPGRYKEFWAQSLVDDLISPQNRINGLDAQVVEARERLGSPNILMPAESEFNGPEWFTNYGLGKFLFYTPSINSPNAKPEPFGGTVMPSQVYEERDRLGEDMKEIAGPQEIEIGAAPKNISTTSGLQLLGEQAERRRASRERGLISMYESIWRHQLDLIWCLRHESDEYERELPDGTWEVQQYDKMHLQGQTKVKIEKQAYVEKSIYQKEAAREAMADRLIIPDTQVARKKLLEMMNLPTDINEDLNRQVDVGKKQWTDFVDSQIIPVIDPGLDDPRIRFQTLGTFLLNDEGIQLQETIDWRSILKAIAGWQDELMVLEESDAMAFQFYGTRDQNQAGQLYEQANMAFEQQSAAYEASVAAGGQSIQEGVPPLPAEPPMAPPPPIFLPPAKEDRVLQIWLTLCQRNGLELAPPQLLFLQFRAVVEAYRLMAEEKEAVMMAPPPGAPGTQEGSPGMFGANPGINFPGAPNPPNPPNVPGGKDRNIMQGFK